MLPVVFLKNESMSDIACTVHGCGCLAVWLFGGVTLLGPRGACWDPFARHHPMLRVCYNHRCSEGGTWEEGKDAEEGRTQARKG